MWSLLKSLIGAMILGILAYSFFFVDFGGQSMASHLADVWQAPVVQGKVDRIRDGVREKLEERLAEAGEQAGRNVARELTSEKPEQIDDEDRRALAEIIREASR